MFNITIDVAVILADFTVLTHAVNMQWGLFMAPDPAKPNVPPDSLMVPRQCHFWEETMLPKTAKHWLGIVATLALSIGATAPALAAAATPISACPYMITAPGSYVVTQNLTAAQTCISISTNNVAIDLQGHSITGNGLGGPSYASNYGIFTNCDVAGGCSKIMVANGTIQNFNEGMLLEGNFQTISGMTVQQNVVNGIDGLTYATVTNTMANGNGGIGIHGSHVIISNSLANYNGSHGMQLGDSTAANVQANNNGADGISMDGNAESSIIDTIANGNSGTGIFLVNSASNSVINSVASGNKTGGIYVTDGAISSRITNSVANNNSTYGISFTCSTDVFGSMAFGNSGGNLVTSGNNCLLVDNWAPWDPGKPAKSRHHQPVSGRELTGIVLWLTLKLLKQLNAEMTSAAWAALAGIYSIMRQPWRAEMGVPDWHEGLVCSAAAGGYVSGTGRR
jgi:parallel beta-helix repeat protein